jgi:hypothetical protein
MKRYYSIYCFVLVLLLANIAFSQTVYVTRTGSKYHRADCSYLRKSAIPMKLSEAASSYSPCSRCNPPTLKGKKVGVTVTKDNNAPIVRTTPTGKTIYEGPRGGHYHYSKSGKKVYERH